MQRLFTMFPRGWPGLALVLLRGAVVLALLYAAYDGRDASPSWVQAIAILLSIALCLGFLTPIATVTALLLHAVLYVGAPLDTAFWVATALVWLDALALTFLGPGAYSVDSYLFGRRIVVLPSL